MQKITFTYNDISLDVNFSAEENTVWMSQKDIATLFSVNVPAINKQIKSLPNTLKNESGISVLEIVAIDGKRRKINHYNLDIIKEVGYKINPSLTEYFVNWCKEELEKDKYQLLPIQSNIIRFNEDNVTLDVKVSPQQFTVWLTQDQMAILFDRNKTVISKHITKIFKQKELDENQVVAKNATTAGDGKTYEVTYYNLDVIISVGFLVHSSRGVIFRRWAINVLKEYMLKGYAIDEKRVMVSQSNYNNLVTKVDNLESRVNTLEKEKEIYLPKHKYIYENQFYEGIEFVSGLVEAANISLVIIDPYVTIKTLQILGYKKNGVPLIVITSSKNDISNKQYEDFNNNHGPLSMYIDDKIHDRYLIIDDSTYYHIGTSFNYIGNKFTQIDKMEDEEMIEVIKNRCKRIIDTSCVYTK